MDEITLDDKTYVSSKRAAQITGYAKDYVGQLCREGRVAARLVGRNWYVLESSIREHRFGTDEKTEIKNIEEITTPISSWEPTNYSSDPAPALIPTLIGDETSQEEGSEINIVAGRAPSIPVIASESSPVSSKVVKEMQSAWHDWFSRTDELEVSREILLESHSIEDKDVTTAQEMRAEAPNDSLEGAQEYFDTETTPITLEKVSEVIERREDASESEEEVVPLHRSFAVPAPTSYQSQAFTREVRLPTYEPEGRIIRERRVIRRKKPSTFVSAVFIVLALLAVSVAVVGSGLTDSFFNKNNLHLAPIQYLGGESSFEKTNR